MSTNTERINVMLEVAGELHNRPITVDRKLTVN